ncbi:LysR substrate-binding domain-containing protein [Halomonas sp. M20]|uniref:LysR substrate-binding domain-containing protein n=1 Tax=Halomonas sp. M20 TaxID=2763264 RepID=UPI001D0BA106|nr:LysR substrate-binding domain-containing protein [Halomonas sp. M20]
MNRNDLRRIDFNLLIVFETLMHERSVTRTAEKLFLGQPAISAALSRLRVLFGDQLFIRVGCNMEPTTRAREIFTQLQPALDAISCALGSTSHFIPTRSGTIFHIGLSDDVELSLFPLLLRRLRFEAPNIALVMHRTNYLNLPTLLNSDEISVGVGCTRKLLPNAKRKRLRCSKLCVLCTASHPQVLSLDDYCKRPHALVACAGEMNSVVDERLAEWGRTRHVTLNLPEFSGLSAQLVDTDIIATVPDYVAAPLTANARLRENTLPFDSPTFELSMIWNALHDNDPADRWLRSHIQTSMTDQQNRIQANEAFSNG